VRYEGEVFQELFQAAMDPDGRAHLKRLICGSCGSGTLRMGIKAPKIKRGTASGPRPFKLYVTDELASYNHKSEESAKKYKGEPKNIVTRYASPRLHQ
jgi:hypothetical protein